MRTLSILTICFVLLGFQAGAQLSYTFKASTAAYAPLTNATSATGGKLWSPSSTFTLPLGFSFKINGTTTQTMYLSGSLLHPAMQGGKQNGFLLMSTGLIDRGTIQGTPKSAVRYATSGAAGSRIFKLELANVGFEDEYTAQEELKDSANIQIWIYEGSNAVEFRFGSSDVQYFNEYFNGKMLSGVIKNFDTVTAAFDKLHFLDGTAAAPVLDSTTTLQMTKGISSFPANGQVYRFSPKGISTSVDKLPGQSLATVFPTRCAGSLQVRNTGKGPLQASVFSTDGRLALQSELPGGDGALDLGRLSPGMYILQLADRQTGASERLRIEKL